MIHIHWWTMSIFLIFIHGLSGVSWTSTVQVRWVNPIHFKINHFLTFATYVLGSSSIWTCQILNFECYCLLQAGALEKIKTTIRYSKFEWATKDIRLITSRFITCSWHQKTEFTNLKCYKMSLKAFKMTKQGIKCFYSNE